MLKNNEQRLEYISNDDNWEIIRYEVAKNEINMPVIRLKRLKGTNIYSIEIWADSMGYGQARFMSIGTKEFKYNGLLKSVYDLSTTQLVAYLREHKI